MSAVAIIGGRKGSKRLPGKNTRLLAGKPLFAHTLTAAIESQVFSRIVVTSDDQAMLDAVEFTDQIILDNRPKELADHITTMPQVALYLLDQYANELYGIKDVCFLSPCNPFRNSGHIHDALTLFRETEADSLISVTKFPFPHELCVHVNNGRISRNWKGPARKAQFQTTYYPNGAIIIEDRDFFAATGQIYSDNTIAYELPWPYCLDIDDADDFATAELLVHMLASK